MSRRRRLDAELVDQGLFPNVGAAMRAVMAGDVSTRDRRLDSPGEQVLPGIELHVRDASAYVSRGGLKLERGLDALGVSPAGLSCLDVGCSTGGFTDCLLKRGAASVVSVDVGHAQFAWALRNDPRVTLLERTNVTALPSLGYGAAFDLAVCDVSFTSVLAVLPAILDLLVPEGWLLALVKPQFEAGRDDVGPGGVVTDPRVRLAALLRVASAFSAAGLGPLGACQSPVRGHKGNVEYLLLGRKGAPVPSLDLRSVVTAGAVALA